MKRCTPVGSPRPSPSPLSPSPRWAAPSSNPSSRAPTSSTRADTGPAAAALAGELISLLVSTPPTVIASGVRFAGATCQAPIASPDPSDPDVYRYVVTAQVVTINT